MTEITNIRLLNQRAFAVLDLSPDQLTTLRVKRLERADTVVLDFGVESSGGLNAGVLLARACLADLADVSIMGPTGQLPVPSVLVRTDHPVPACLQSQYAGCRVQTEDYFAMGSGPMRSLAREEELLEEFPETEDGEIAVGILEASQLPTEAAISELRNKLPDGCRLVLAVARTASLAGTIQVVARSVETALHKLHSLHFPLNTLISGSGIAPLPPIAKNDLHAIGRTNDAILYGATVNLWVHCEDELITAVGPRVPSSASSSHGRTFLSLFKEANHDFYAMDAALFSPAVVVFHNIRSGRSFQYGSLEPSILAESFGM